MKTVFILSLILAVTFSYSLENAVLHDLYGQWKLAYKKVYTSASEESFRFATFLENYYTIIQHNAQDKSVTLGLNEFSDLTSEEFARFYTGLLPKQTFDAETFVFNTEDLPASIDWRAKGAVTDVKNQGMCGSCWAFSAIGALEGLYYLNNSQLLAFSEQNIVDCSAGHGCLGGWMTDAFTYAAQGGIETEDDYPYKGIIHGKCAFDSSKAHAVNTGYYNVTSSSSDQLKAALAQQPVSVAIQANQAVFQHYKGGVIQKDCGSKLDHGVLAVGYDTIEGVEAFIIKNSWGPKWGNSGYVYLSTDGSANGGLGVCGILSVPSIPYKH